MSDYEATIRAVLSIPFVKELKRENKHLRKELKALKNLIYSLPEFRRDNVSTQPVQRSQVRIKKEPGQDDDDVVIVDSPKNPTAPKENIVYVIDDTPSETESQADAVQASEEEEEAEEEAEEEEAEEAEEEEAEAEGDAEVEEVELNLEPVRIKKVIYWKDTDSGDLYAYLPEDEVGDKVGSYVNGKPVFD